MLAASAFGLDTCPMEGFNARKVAKALGLSRDLVLPLATPRRTLGASPGGASLWSWRSNSFDVTRPHGAA